MRELLVLATLAVAASARMAGMLPGGSGALQSSFSCADRPFGYYADVEHACKAFHVCYPVMEEGGTLMETAHFTFICGQDAVFSQDSLTCAHPTEAFPCTDSTAIFEVSNEKFGVIPEENLAPLER
ncbi:U-scoloptoxin(01)-Er1a isoform X2 [Procambarus clarkii]|uniref:U-scoloptoxin(01)-Er1a isoform X2 n=1 Tax=Procambarus clarkii TaxID=6728 RepID=UPI001E673895|nr:U-scoloptoxin(01)-Er1a-like isoform X2 [Procambarus clarkii]